MMLPDQLKHIWKSQWFFIENVRRFSDMIVPGGGLALLDC